MAIKPTTPLPQRTVAGLIWNVTRCFNLVIDHPDKRFTAFSPYGTDRKTWTASITERDSNGNLNRFSERHAGKRFRSMKAACNWLAKQMD